jgi:hypothetical protein
MSVSIIKGKKLKLNQKEAFSFLKKNKFCKSFKTKKEYSEAVKL